MHQIAKPGFAKDLERLKFSLNAAGIGVWEVDIVTNTVIWDDRCRSLFGLSKNNSLPYEEAIRFIHSEDLAGVNEAVQAALRGERDGVYDLTYRTLGADDGLLRWVNFSGTAYFDAGQLSWFGGVARDVTEQLMAHKKVEESERRFRSLAERVPQFIWMTGSTGINVTYINKPYLDFLGLSRVEDFLDVAWERLIHPDDIETVYRIYGKAMETQQPYTLEARYKNAATGNFHWFHIQGSPRYETDGSYAGFVGTLTDITASKIANDQLRESEQRFRTLVEEAPVATCLFFGRELVIEVANEAMIQVWGKGPGVIGMPLAQALPELKGQHFLPLLDELFTTGNSYSKKGGPADLVVGGKLETFYFDYDFKPLLNAAGEVYAILETAVDVTQQVLAQQKIEASQQSLLALFEESPVGIATLSADDAFVFETANSFYAALVGRLPADIIGKPLMTALPEIEGQGFLELLKTVVETGKPFLADEVGVALLRKGVLETVYVNVTYQPRTEGGIITGILVVAIDVTEQVLARKKVEEKDVALENALEQVRLSKEAAELGTFDMNMQSGYMHWDDRCRKLFGISHTEPVSYENDFIDRLYPDDRQRVLAVLSATFDKFVSNGDYDVAYRTVGADDGLIRWVRAKGKVYFNPENVPLRFIGSVLDITEQITAVDKIERLVEERTKELARSNDNLQTINNELKRSNQQLEEFTHAASHDLKEPVRKILTYTNLLRDQLSDGLQPSELRSFNRIEDATKRMGNLIDDLLVCGGMKNYRRRLKTLI